jgi:hypothetical protein
VYGNVHTLGPGEPHVARGTVLPTKEVVPVALGFVPVAGGAVIVGSASHNHRWAVN